MRSQAALHLARQRRERLFSGVVVRVPFLARIDALILDEYAPADLAGGGRRLALAAAGSQLRHPAHCRRCGSPRGNLRSSRA
jgi:hypothetical protein